jgi:hypothetical protein
VSASPPNACLLYVGIWAAHPAGPESSFFPACGNAKQVTIISCHIPFYFSQLVLLLLSFAPTILT